MSAGSKREAHPCAGFSLVELAVVLSIIGLIVGGIVVGRDLVKSAQLNSLGSDVKKYQTAVSNFRAKYNYLPGDMPNATTYWTSAGGSGADSACQTASTAATSTCNGDGDGQVESPNASTVFENLHFWQQLALAGFAEGAYTGGFSGGKLVANINSPPSRFSSGIWISKYTGFSAGDASTFAANYGHIMTVVANNSTGTSLMVPADALTVDAKFDDGNPMSGTVIGYKGTATLKCTDKYNTAVGSDTGAKYNISNTNQDCFVYFVQLY